MMKRTLLYIVYISGIITSNAQIIETGETNPVWGVRAAFDVNLPGKVRSNIINDKMFRTGTGGTVGVVCNINLWNKIYLEPTVSLFYDTYSYKDRTIFENDYDDYVPEVYKIGFRIPVVVGYSIPITKRISIAPFIGPELSYAFAGDIKRQDCGRPEAKDVSLFGKFGSQRRIECGWKFGLAFYTGMWNFNIDGTIGMTNLMTNGMIFRESRGSVSITRFF